MDKVGDRARILVVDDDALLRRVVRFVLMEAGYEVAAVSSAATALRIIEQEDVHLIVLDVNMPGMNGLDLCRQLRAKREGVPVIFVSGRKELDDKVAGFDAGGDDYLTKPFEPRELAVRVRALLSRRSLATSSSVGEVLHAGGLTLHLSELAVELPDGSRAALTPTELRLLQYLMLNERRVVTRDQILGGVWGSQEESESNQVDVYIRRLRRKIEREGVPEHIETVRGLGYRLLASPTTTARPDDRDAG